MDIKTAKFIVSGTRLAHLPPAGVPEYAFVGRSNVGKSSLINALTGYSDLAKTSSTPGKTQLINFFMVNESWYLVDLPGYGYAKVSKKIRSQFSGMITNYLEKRPTLMNVFLLIDSRHPPQASDLEFMEYMGTYGIPFSIVFTKCDKPSQTALAKNLEHYKTVLLESWEELPPVFVTSSEKKRGLDELRAYIGEVNAGLL